VTYIIILADGERLYKSFNLLFLDRGLAQERNTATLLRQVDPSFCGDADIIDNLTGDLLNIEKFVRTSENADVGSCIFMQFRGEVM